jgi:hypothetical protein
MSANRPDRPGMRRLGEGQGMPDDFLVGFTETLMARRQQLLGAGQPPKAARQRAIAEALHRFDATAEERDWTVDRRRLASLAADTLGLEDEYRDQHGYEPQLARLSVIREVLEGEQARNEIPELCWREPDPPQPPDPDLGHLPARRTGPGGRTDRAWTREAGGER